VQEEVAVFDQLYRKNRNQEEKIINSQQLITRSYRWINGVIYQGHSLNWIECVEVKGNIATGKEEQNRFTHITNLEVSSINCRELSSYGRVRWKIENEGFNIQKNAINYNISTLEEI